MTDQGTTTVEGIIQALKLPENCRVNQRVPKKLLVENGAPTAADKRQIIDCIEEIQWVAALKPSTIGVAEYRDNVREYLEIVVLAVKMRSSEVKQPNVARLAALVHRAVPYPVVLLLGSEQSFMLSLVHKRLAQNEAGKVVLDGDVVSLTLPDSALSTIALSAFKQAMTLGREPQTTLLNLYQRWMDNVFALMAARLTGSFKIVDNQEQATARRHALQECERLESEATRLIKQAGKEIQLARQVEVNLALKRVQAQLAAAREQL